jgi:hypothetical protein
MMNKKTTKILRNAGIIAGIATVSSLAADPHLDINKIYVAVLAGAMVFLIECRTAFEVILKSKKANSGTFFF